MGMRGWVLLGMSLAVGWWFSPWSPRVPPAPRIRFSADAASAHPTNSNPPCPSPQRVADGADPLQSPVPAPFPALTVEGMRLEPLAGFSVDARVLSRRDYRLGREADVSPTDLALGWGRMRDDRVLSRLVIEQRGRWYRYSWRDRGPPIPSREIARSSANMHIVPANAAAAATLARIEAGQRVRIDGWLVEMAAEDGWRWRSSLTRDDQGRGACELVYACSILAE